MEPVNTGKTVSISTILQEIGLGDLDVGYLFIGLTCLIIILVILLIIQIVKSNQLKKRMDKFMLGKDASSLEKDIAKMYEENTFIKDTLDKNKKDIRMLYKKMESGFQKMGLVKYDAFKQIGGQLSFSLALLNEKNDGFIINSVHSTDGCYSYTKEISNGESSLFLGEEEAKALQMAISEK